MTLHPQELVQIERREAQSIAKRYGICHFAFDDCRDTKDPDVFYRFCDRAGNRCPLGKERIENSNLINH